MKPYTIQEKLAYDQGIMDFLDFILPQVGPVTHMHIAALYVEWNRRAGGSLEGNPLPERKAI